MKEGFGTMRLVIDCGAEAWKEPRLCSCGRRPPSSCRPRFPSQGRTTDQALMPLETRRSSPRRASSSLSPSLTAATRPRASTSERTSPCARGLSRELPLAAVTITPARMLGIDGGRIRGGRPDADLVLWNGEPFEVTSKPVA